VSDDKRALAGSLLLERLELKRDIAALKADLLKRAEVIVKFGSQLRANPQVIAIDDQALPPDYAQRAQNFNSDELDVKRVADLVDELRKKTDRLGAAELEIRALGYPVE
jgi:hypothetical protein